MKVFSTSENQPVPIEGCGYSKDKLGLFLFVVWWKPLY